MNEIQLFQNPEFGTVRTITTKDGAIIYCAKDIALALGYKDTINAIKLHCKGAPSYHPITDQRGRIQEARFITEVDVIRLITHSKLPNAQVFEKWLFEEIAPKAVKGDLLSREDVYKFISSPESMLQIVTNWKIDRDRADTLEIENNNLRPRAALADAVIVTKDEINVADLSLILQQVPGSAWAGGRNTLHKRLMADGYTRRNRNGNIVPSQKACKLGVLRVKESHRPAGDGGVHTDLTTMVTGKGQRYFIERYAQVVS